MSWDIFHDDLMDILKNSLTWGSRRHEVIAGNVANLDTPHYTAKDLDFNNILTSYLNGSPQIHLTSTHPRHIPGNRQHFGFIQDTGKEVDIDREMVAMAENQLSFQASVQMLSKKLDALRTVIEGDPR